MSETRREGGCLCGKVRYSIAWPPLQVVTCQCSHCQKQAGSSISVIAVVNRDDLSLSGELSTYADTGASGGAVNRHFCGACGSPVMTTIPSADADGRCFVKAGTLDDRSGLKPAAHFWTSSAQDWMLLPEGGVKLERQ